MHWELRIGIHRVSYQISQCKTYTCIKRSILTGLMPYKLLRGKQFYTNQTENDLCVCIRFLQTMKPFGSCNIFSSQRSYLINKFTNDEIINILNFIVRWKGNGAPLLCDVLPFEINNENFLLILGIFCTIFGNYPRSSIDWRVELQSVGRGFEPSTDFTFHLSCRILDLLFVGKWFLIWIF